VILHFERKELDKKWEAPLLRAFYWSAYLGLSENLDLMIDFHKWSPFMKSFEKKDCLTGAVIGK
jgi:hypothetical protein